MSKLAGQPYVVPEGTAERFVPTEDGRIIPSRRDTYNITVPIQGLIPYREPSRFTGTRGRRAWDRVRRWLGKSRGPR